MTLDNTNRHPSHSAERAMATGTGTNKNLKSFQFKQVFGPDSSQEEVYNNSCSPLIEHVLNGFNGTYFVYGQTGTGKTHSMGVLNQIDEHSNGVIPSSLNSIFSNLYSRDKQRNQRKNMINS